MTSVERRPSLVLTFTRDVTFVQPGYPISSTPKTLSRQKDAEWWQLENTQKKVTNGTSNTLQRKSLFSFTNSLIIGPVMVY
jgi:hypothetical protein